MKIYNEYFKVGKNKIAVQCFMQPKYLRQDNTIVLLHEGLGCIEMWKDWPKKLADRVKVNLVVYSRLGMGQSSKEEKKKNINFMNEESIYYLPKIIYSYCKDEPILLGHSDGASISIIYAGNKLPCKGIILEAPHVMVEKITINEIKNIKKKWKNSALKEKLKKYHKYPSDAFFSWCNVWLSKEFVNWNIASLVKNITCPILLIQGSEDQYGTLKQIDLIKRNYLSQVNELILKNCKHSPHLEHPKEVIDKIEKFIKNILIKND